MGPSKTDQVKKETQEIESLCENLKKQISDAVDRLNIIEKDEGDRRGIERDLEDQIRYRQSEKDLKQCDEDLAELERSQGEHNLNQMKRDLKRLQEEENILAGRVRPFDNLFFKKKNYLRTINSMEAFGVK